MPDAARMIDTDFFLVEWKGGIHPLGEVRTFPFPCMGISIDVVGSAQCRRGRKIAASCDVRWTNTMLALKGSQLTKRGLRSFSLIACYGRRL